MTKRTCTLDGCDKPFNAKGFCRGHYWRFKRYGDPLAVRHGKPAIFLAEQIASDRCRGECWIWPYSLTGAGYGQLHWKGANVTAHRQGKKLDGHSIGGNEVCRHTCHDRSCFNPDHIVLGSQWDNIQDMIKADRMLLGSQRPNSKLTEDRVLHILANCEHLSNRQVAIEFEVSRSTIGDIRNGRTWGWLTGR